MGCCPHAPHHRLPLFLSLLLLLTLQFSRRCHYHPLKSSFRAIKAGSGEDHSNPHTHTHKHISSGLGRSSIDKVRRHASALTRTCVVHHLRNSILYFSYSFIATAKSK
jgi:hypothetical protein